MTTQNSAATSLPAAEDQIIIFDTTLRDGEQAPGCSMTVAEKRQVARQLGRLGVDVIEAGFPAASPGDWDAVHSIARDAADWTHRPVICGLARATERDIESAARALAPAAAFRIHTFLATSDVHLKYKLQLSRAQVITKVRHMVAFAAGFNSLSAFYSCFRQHTGVSPKAYVKQISLRTRAQDIP